MAVARGIDNVCGFELMVTLISNFTMTFFIQPMPPKAAAVKKELLKIDIKACKSVSILVHGLRRRRLPETKNAIMFLISHILFSRIHQDLYKL